MTFNLHFVALKTLARKEVKRFLRIWQQTILPPAITLTLYLLIFGNLIGSRIGEMDGFRYMDYIAPGIVMMAIINNSYSNVVSSLFSARFQKYFEELMVAPIPNYVILTGYIAGGVARGLLVAIVVTIVASAFAAIQVTHVFVTLAVVILSATLFSLAGFLNAIFAKSFDDITIIPNFVLTPLTYLGGVFYSIHLLPEFWQTASLANPILYMVNAFRFGILGVSDIPIGTAFAIIIGFIVVLYSIGLYVLHKGIGIRT